MRKLAALTLLVSLVTGNAWASNVHTYDADPYNSSGVLSGLRNLAVNPATALSTLEPVEPAATVAPPAEGAVKLVFHNPTLSMANLYVNGIRLGDIETLDTIVISGVKPGIYDVVIVLPNGFREAYKVSTDPNVAPKQFVPAPALQFSNHEVAHPTTTAPQGS